MKYRWIFLILALTILCAEGLWLAHYLSDAVEIGDERLGAYFLLAGTLSWLLAVWTLIKPSQHRHRVTSLWILIPLGALLMYLSYVFLTRYW